MHLEGVLEHEETISVLLFGDDQPLVHQEQLPLRTSSLVPLKHCEQRRIGIALLINGFFFNLATKNWSAHKSIDLIVVISEILIFRKNHEL